jgi:hypothetical protein
MSRAVEYPPLVAAAFLPFVEGVRLLYVGDEVDARALVPIAVEVGLIPRWLWGDGYRSLRCLRRGLWKVRGKVIGRWRLCSREGEGRLTRWWVEPAETPQRAPHGCK